MKKMARYLVLLAVESLIVISDLANQPRLNVGDLIPPGVTVNSGTKVKSLVRGDTAQCVDMDDGTRECAHHVLLAANPLNSVRLALNADIIQGSQTFSGMGPNLARDTLQVCGK